MITWSKNFLIKYEKELSWGALFLGFIVDNLTLRRSDLLAENLVLFGYILIGTLGLIIQNRAQEREFIFKRHHTVSLLLMQFAFGGLFSAFLVFYGRSSSFEVSWPFLLLLLLGLLGNEIWKKQYSNMPFQTSVLFLAIFSISLFLVPTVFGSISVYVFFLSQIFAIFLFVFLLRVVKFFAPKVFNKNRKKVFGSVIFVTGLMNVFYFTNIIPPLPLVLKDAGEYHKLSRKENNTYYMYEEEKPWYKFFLRDTMSILPGEAVYVFSSIYSPSTINTPIVHSWYYFDEKNARWVNSNKIEVPIYGGREKGYKMYSTKTAVFPGLWRVDIETPRGQTIGRIKFKIREVNSPPETYLVVK